MIVFIWHTLHGVFKIVTLSSLKEDPNSRLYSKPNPSFLLNGFPLLIVPKIKVME